MTAREHSDSIRTRLAGASQGSVISNSKRGRGRFLMRCMCRHRCEWCIEGYYFNDESCEPCGDGMLCQGYGSPPLPIEGYWMDPEESDPKKRFVQCPMGDKACKGCSNLTQCAEEYQCNENYRGRACDVPAPGYWKNHIWSGDEEAVQECASDFAVPFGWLLTFSVGFWVLINYHLTKFESTDLLLNSLQNMALVILHA